MAIVDLENDEPVCPGWKDKINDLMDEVRALKASFKVVPVGSIIDWFGWIEDPDLFDVNGVGLDGSEMEGFAQTSGQALTGSSLTNVDGDPFAFSVDTRGKVRVTVNTQTGGAADPEFAELGFSGGEKEVTLTAAQSGLRDHVHNTWSNDAASSYASGSSGNSSPTVSDLDSGGVLNVDGDSSLDGEQDAVDAHTNLQPYFVVATLIRFK